MFAYTLRTAARNLHAYNGNVRQSVGQCTSWSRQLGNERTYYLAKSRTACQISCAMHRDKVREALVSAVVSSCILAAFLPPPRPTSEAVIQAIVGSKQAANFTAEDLIP